MRLRSSCAPRAGFERDFACVGDAAGRAEIELFEILKNPACLVEEFVDLLAGLLFRSGRHEKYKTGGRQNSWVPSTPSLRHPGERFLRTPNGGTGSIALSGSFVLFDRGALSVLELEVPRALQVFSIRKEVYALLAQPKRRIPAQVLALQYATE
jgi:hypothetical protein